MKLGIYEQVQKRGPKNPVFPVCQNNFTNLYANVAKFRRKRIVFTIENLINYNVEASKSTVAAGYQQSVHVI